MLGSFHSPLIIPPNNFAALKGHIDGCNDWFHGFTFNEGLTTTGRDPSEKKLHHLCLPASLKGSTVLDVGAYEGYFSFLCVARGADRVVAVDQFVWNWPGSNVVANFEAVHTALASKVERVNAPVETLPADLKGEQFDVVLFLGVLYHAPDMIGYLKNIAAVTRGVCVLETFMDALELDDGHSIVYDPGELNNDASNWFGPNLRALEIMVKRAGFRRIEFMNFWDVNTRNTGEGKSPYSAIKTGRAVFHLSK